MDRVDDLNYDFNYNMFLAKTMLANLENLGDRERALKWMKKLISCNKSLDEMKLRNDFMYYLVLNVQNRDMRPPFVDHPPPGPLPKLAHLLPGGTMGAMTTADEWIEKGKNEPKPLLYEKSPDGGAFLAAQPIPRCGAFCYLAVVRKAD